VFVSFSGVQDTDAPTEALKVRFSVLIVYVIVDRA
jgi:hypothetical protein